MRPHYPVDPFPCRLCKRRSDLEKLKIARKFSTKKIRKKPKTFSEIEHSKKKKTAEELLDLKKLNI